MNSKEKETFRLETRRQAFDDALSEVKFAEGSGETAVKALERLRRLTGQSLAEAQSERGRLIADAGSLIDEPVADYADSSRFHGCSDPVLGAALDVLVANGCADEESGDVDTVGHFARIGRFILTTDSQGFRGVDEYPSYKEAAERLGGVDADAFRASL